jgi:regulatory protein
MTITAIRQQERLKGRYSIYVDEKYAFSLSADALLQEGLHAGMELSEAELKHFKKLSADDKAYGLALAYIARRMRSHWELQDYFRRKGYDGGLAAQLLERLEKAGLVDDKTFAEAWVRNRRLLKSVSRRRLQQELRQKRVADEHIDAALSEDTADEHQVLQELVARKRKQSRYQDNLKLMRYLVGQGFSYDDVKHALERDDQDA